MLIILNQEEFYFALILTIKYIQSYVCEGECKRLS